MMRVLPLPAATWAPGSMIGPSRPGAPITSAKATGWILARRLAACGPIWRSVVGSGPRRSGQRRDRRAGDRGVGDGGGHAAGGARDDEGLAADARLQQIGADQQEGALEAVVVGAERRVRRIDPEAVAGHDPFCAAVPVEARREAPGQGRNGSGHRSAFVFATTAPGVMPKYSKSSSAGPEAPKPSMPTKSDFCARPRSPQSELSPEIRVPEWAEDKARGIAREKGRDYYALRAEWLVFAQAEATKGNPPKNAGAAFVAYCGKQGSLR